MSRRFCLLLMLSVAGCSATTSHGSFAPGQQAASQDALCGGRLRPVSGAEIAEMIVGSRVRFAGDRGVCPQSIWITSNWELSLHPDGEAWLQCDRAGHSGSYIINDDQLCISSNAGTDCFRLYRDKRGRIYLGQGDAPEFEPAMVTIEQ